MAMALRPRARASSINSRYGSQALAEGLRVGDTAGTGPGAGSAPGPVITPVRGFAGGGGGARRGGHTAGPAAGAGPAPGPVITPLAGFAATGSEGGSEVGS